MKNTLSMFLAFVPLLILETGVVAAEPAQPNVVLFLVDDMGWMGSSAYG